MTVTTRKPWSRLFGAADLLTAFVVLLGIFAGLPARWLPIDLAGGLLGVLFAASGVALLANHRLAPLLARVAAFAALAVGMLLVLALGVAASWLAGVYGPVGRGGALLLTLVAALVVPYLLFLPAVQLLWIGPRERPAKAETT
jgi:hypothetical protein